MSTVSNFARPRPDFGSTPNTATSAILGQLEALDNVLRLSMKQDQPPAAPAAMPAPRARAAEPARAQPNFATAFDLLGRASEAMDVLQARCTELEGAAKVRADHFKMALDVAHQQIKACEERAASFEAKMAESGALLEAAREQAALADQRAEAADQRAEAAERRAQAAEQSANDAAEWLKVYYERIISAFGMRGQPEALRPVA